MTVTIDLTPELETELRDEATREGTDLSVLILNTLRQRRPGNRHIVPHLSKEESELLLKINAGLPEETWKRHHILDGRRQAETLTPEEHAELLQINDEIEEDGVRRIGYVAKLAEFRGKSLDEMMKSLGLGSRHSA